VSTTNYLNLKSTLPLGSGLHRSRPPQHMGMKMLDFVQSYVSLICSYEYFVFNSFLREHPAARNPTLMSLLPSYTMKQWSDGRFTDELIDLANDGAVDLGSLREWARAMLAFEHSFNKLGVFNPVAWLRNHGIITNHLGGLSWKKLPGDLASKI
jgi:hypothetical protein